MSNLTDLRKNARQYPGSYVIVEDTKAKIGTKMVSWIRHYSEMGTGNTVQIKVKFRGTEAGLVVDTGIPSVYAIAKKFQDELNVKDEFLVELEKYL